MDWPSLHIGHLVLVASFMGNAIVSGMGYANSAYYYGEWLETFREGSWLTSMVGSLNIATVCLAGPLSGFLMNRTSFRVTVASGTIISVIGLVGSAFSTNIYSLLALYFVAGLGWGICYVPICLSVTHYYEPKYHGLVVGLVAAGAGFGHFVTPPIADSWTKAYSWRGSLLIQAGVSANMLLLAACLRPMPTMTSTDGKAALKLKLFKNLDFLIMFIHNLFFTTGLSVIFVHVGYSIQLYANVDELLGALAVSVLGLASLFGKMIHAVISKLPSVNPVTQVLVSYSISGIGTILVPFMWNFGSASFLSAVIGFCIGPYGSAIIIIIMGIVATDDVASAYGYLNFMGGVGLYIGAPIAGALFDGTGDYLASMIFGGVMLILSALLLLRLSCTWRTRRMKTERHIEDYGTSKPLFKPMEENTV